MLKTDACGARGDVPGPVLAVQAGLQVLQVLWMARVLGERHGLGGRQKGSMAGLD
jgi:hypothetical protein